MLERTHHAVDITGEVCWGWCGKYIKKAASEREWEVKKGWEFVEALAFIMWCSTCA